MGPIATNSSDILTLVEALGYFNDDYDDEVLRLFEQSISIYAQVYGSSSSSVAIGEHGLGNAFRRRAKRACDANYLERCMANLELALLRYREEARIFRAIGLEEDADRGAQSVVVVEEQLQEVAVAIAAAAATRG